MAVPKKPRSRRRESTVTRRRATYLEAVQQIRRRCDEPDLVLADIAADVGASPRQLQRCFADDGDSFSDRLIRTRMERALMLLKQRVLVWRVSRRVGYRHDTHFCAAFRRYFNAPLGDVRSALRLYSAARRSPRGRREAVPHWRRRVWSQRQRKVHAVARELQKRGAISRRPRRKRRLA